MSLENLRDSPTCNTARSILTCHHSAQMCRAGGAETATPILEPIQRDPTNQAGSRGKGSMHVGRNKLIAAALALTLAAATGYAQTTQQPSAKVTAKSSNTVLIPPTTGTGGWVTVLENTIKMPQNKDVFVTAAFETGVY